MQGKVAAAAAEAEQQLLSGAPSAEQKMLRQMLCRVIGVSESKTPPKGSCL